MSLRRDLLVDAEVRIRDAVRRYRADGAEVMLADLDACLVRLDRLLDERAS